MILGGGRPTGIARVRDRYWVPSKHLCRQNVTINVSATAAHACGRLVAWVMSHSQQPFMSDRLTNVNDGASDELSLGTKRSPRSWSGPGLLFLPKYCSICKMQETSLRLKELHVSAFAWLADKKATLSPPVFIPETGQHSK